MEVKLGRADIVILASAHNPSIIAPDWLKANTVIAEEPKDFVHTPSFSAFESESFVLVVDHQRLQITGKKSDVDSLNSLAAIAEKYVKLLPHIPYKALGLNFAWTVQFDEEASLPEIGLSIKNSDLSSILEGHELNYGGIIYAKNPPYVLKLVVEPQTEHTFVHNFNYNHELGQLSNDGIVKLIHDFSTRYEHSARIVRNLYTVGE